MQDRELSRRAVVVGLAGAIALVFAPLNRFMAGLARMLAAILGPPLRNGRVQKYARIEIFVNGERLEGVDEISYQAGLDLAAPGGDETALVFARWQQGDWHIDNTAGSDSNDGRSGFKPLCTYAELRRRLQA